MKSGPRELAVYHAQVIAGAQLQQQPKKGHAPMPELNLDDIAKQALESTPAGGWGTQALQRHFKLNYGQAVHVIDAMESLKATGGLLKSESEQAEMEMSQLSSAIAAAQHQPGDPTAANQAIPAGYHIGTRGKSKGKLVKDVPEKAPKAAPAPAAGPSTDDATKVKALKLTERIIAQGNVCREAAEKFDALRAEFNVLMESIPQR